jgi:hypothetical protein
MKRNYISVIEKVKEIALAHPQVNSAESGRELGLDTKKKDLFPKVYIDTVSSPFSIGQGSAEAVIVLNIKVVDKQNKNRSNIEDILNNTHVIFAEIVATLLKYQLIRYGDSITLEPIRDSHDSQVSGWMADVRTYPDVAFQCYPVDNFSQYNYYENTYNLLSSAIYNKHNGCFTRQIVYSNSYILSLGTGIGNLTELLRVSGNSSNFRIGGRGSEFVIDCEITHLGFNGAENTDWENLFSTSDPSSSRPEFRDGVRNCEYVIDQALTVTGFNGIENTDWVNLISRS